MKTALLSARNIFVPYASTAKGQTIRELFCYKNLRGDSGNELLNAFLDTMETRKSNIIHYEVENEGHIGYAEGYIIPFEDYTFGIFRNMTKRVEAQLETINEKNKLTMALKPETCRYGLISPKATPSIYLMKIRCHSRE